MVGLISSEALLFVLVWYFSRRMKFQAVIFLAAGMVCSINLFRCPSLLAICIYKAESLNAFCAEHWRSFAKQPYFDENGVFWSALISGPLLVLLLCILVINRSDPRKKLKNCGTCDLRR